MVPDRISDISDPGGSVNGFVTLDGVSLTYGGAGGTLAIDGLAMAVAKGEFTVARTMQ